MIQNKSWVTYALKWHLPNNVNEKASLLAQPNEELMPGEITNINGEKKLARNNNHAQLIFIETEKIAREVNYLIFHNLDAQEAYIEAASSTASKDLRDAMLD